MRPKHLTLLVSNYSKSINKGEEFEVLSQAGDLLFSTSKNQDDINTLITNLETCDTFTRQYWILMNIELWYQTFYDRFNEFKLMIAHL